MEQRPWQSSPLIYFPVAVTTCQGFRSKVLYALRLSPQPRNIQIIIITPDAPVSSERIHITINNSHFQFYFVPLYYLFICNLFNRPPTPI
jgi:hypothetical protein